MNLQRRLVSARKRAGLSQAELAKRLGVSPGTVAGWESRGEHAHAPRWDRMGKIAKALGVSVAELIA